MSASTSASEAPRPRHALRGDLRLYPGPRINRAPSWLLYDPVRHSYFQLDPNAYAVLSAWTGAADADTLADVVAAQAGFVPPGTVESFIEFAHRNELIDDGAGGWRGHAHRQRAKRSSLLMWLVHNYLFIKIPIWRPRHAFERTSFVVAPLFTRAFGITTALVALAALYLVSRQWSAFVGTFPAFLSLDGAFVFALALVGTKTVHELAHAFTAARYGCRVSSIGVAFMVMMPMLYCDVTDSWRLPDRRQRMAIDVAGIVAELVLAVYSAAAWVLFPDGPLRSAAFLVATASLVSSLLINLNPMMRFDGYLIMADTLGVPNLQTRAFALLRWWVRERLFDLGAPKPDSFGALKHRLVLAYAATIVVYRAIVYAGIALLVYHATFKLLGIALFAVEVGWFLVAPVWKEIAMWWRLRDAIEWTPRSRASACVAASVLVLVVFPFRNRVVVPAILEPVSYARIYPTSPAMVQSVAVHVGDRVAAGDVLATLVSPQNERDRSLAQTRLALVEAKLMRRSSVTEDRAATLPLDMERKLQIDRLDGLDRERRELVLRSPIDGTVRDLDPDLDAGRWVGRDAQIALVVAGDGAVGRGYLRDMPANVIGRGDSGRFYPDSAYLNSVPAHVADVSYAAAARLDIAYLSSVDGGPIAARPMPDHSAAPDAAVFPVRFTADVGTPRMVTRGVVLLDGARESIAGGALRRLAAVLVRESGF